MAVVLLPSVISDEPQAPPQAARPTKARQRRTKLPACARTPATAKPAPRRVVAEPDGPTVDLLLVHTPPTRPAPPRNGVKRWVRAGIIYREVSLQEICEDPYENTRSFHQYNGMVRAKPYRG